MECTKNHTDDNCISLLRVDWEQCLERFWWNHLTMKISQAKPEDAEAVASIYNHYIENTVITFEEKAVSADEMRGRIADVTANLPWLVCEVDGAVAGYAYATQLRARSAYRYSAETTVYLDSAQVGKGLGTRLYETLIAELKAKSIHTVIGGIALPNAASVALHEKMGYRKVAHYEQVGWKFGKWIDVGYWQRFLE